MKVPGRTLLLWFFVVDMKRHTAGYCKPCCWLLVILLLVRGDGLDDKSAVNPGSPLAFPVLLSLNIPSATTVSHSALESTTYVPYYTCCGQQNSTLNHANYRLSPATVYCLAQSCWTIFSISSSQGSLGSQSLAIAQPPRLVQNQEMHAGGCFFPLFAHTYTEA